MVVFTCNNCGDSLQKPKVAKHYQFHSRCQPAFLTCVDCHKDFRGEEYIQHTKCITEDERYGGKGFTLKPGANKGERKQQEWINVVQNLLNSSISLTGPERKILNTLSRHENIPRKKAKFLNFIRSVFGNRENMLVIESLWTKMEESFKQSTEKDQLAPAKESNSVNGKAEMENDVSENQNNENVIKENGHSVVKDENAENASVLNGNLSEKQKKKKSKKRALETTDVQEEETVNNGNESGKQEKKKSKKAALETTDIQVEEPVTNGNEPGKQEKKKKPKKAALETTDIQEEEPVTNGSESGKQKKKKSKKTVLETTDIQEEEPVTNGNESDKQGKKKKSEKTALETSVIQEEEPVANDNEPRKQEKKKKSKKRDLETSDIQEEEPAIKKRLENDLKEETDISAPQEEDSSKFSWKNTIIDIVSNKEDISLEKLKKKVIAKYLEHSNCSNSDKATSKFDKMIKKVSKIIITDNRVSLS